MALNLWTFYKKRAFDHFCSVHVLITIIKWIHWQIHNNTDTVPFDFRNVRYKIYISGGNFMLENTYHRCDSHRRSSIGDYWKFPSEMRKRACVHALWCRDVAVSKHVFHNFFFVVTHPRHTQITNLIHTTHNGPMNRLEAHESMRDSSTTCPPSLWSTIGSTWILWADNEKFCANFLKKVLSCS